MDNQKAIPDSFILIQVFKLEILFINAILVEIPLIKIVLISLTSLILIKWGFGQFEKYL